MKKNYVLDANVLLHDPHAIFKFEDNDVIIPIFAIEEIDQFKREGSERGRNARTIARLLDELRESEGTLSQGVPLESGGSLRIAIPERRPSSLVGLESHSQDLAILQTAIEARDRDAAVRVLDGVALSGVQVDDNGRALTAAVDGGAPALSRVLDGFAAGGIDVLDIGLRRPTLDDVFLSLTGRAAATDTDAVEVPA